MPRWNTGSLGANETLLVRANPAEDPIEVTMAMDDDGWTVSFHVGIRPDRTLRQVEDFIERARQLLLDEPVDAL